MKRRLYAVLLFIVMGIGGYAQEIKKESVSDSIKVESRAFSKEEKNRNVMLNASNNAGPREVNIGLPFTGDIVILEDNLAPTYTFWPQNPLTVWRYDKNIGRIGLLNFQETAIYSGKVGYSVNSYTQEGGRKFRGFLEMKSNTRGMLKGSVNISGPIKKDWYYSLGAFVSRDPGFTDLPFDSYMDDMEMAKIQLTKRFGGRKGKLRFGYKYADSKMTVDRFFPFRYKEDGSTSQLDWFKLGEDSYLPKDGILRGTRVLSGKEYSYHLGDDNSNLSHVLDLGFEYKFDNKMKLSFSSRYINVIAGAGLAYPLFSYEDPSDNNISPYAVFTKLDGTPYGGPVGISTSQILDDQKTETILGRLELTQKVNKHNWRIGLHYNRYSIDLHSENALYYHSLEKDYSILHVNIPTGNPSFPLMQITNKFGNLMQNMDPSVLDNGTEEKIALYASDDLDISDRLKLSIGGRLEQLSCGGNYYKTEDREANIGKPYKDIPTSPIDKSVLNFVYSAKADLRLTSKIGLLGEYTFNRNANLIVDAYGVGFENVKQTDVAFGRFGAYLNHPKLSIVSAITYIKKAGIPLILGLDNPEAGGERELVNFNYDIQTIGWTTDIIAKPFENFELHYLLTIQNPKHENFTSAAFGQELNYNKVVPGISKVLMEVDPSYHLFDRKMKLWASLRYFGEEYADRGNILSFKPRWETFAGVDYKFSKKLNASLKVVNLLDQRGTKSEIRGLDLATDPTPYYNTIQTGQMILPRHAEFILNYSF